MFNTSLASNGNIFITSWKELEKNKEKIEEVEVTKDIAYWVKVVNDSMETYANRNLKKLGITLSQAKVMSFINERKKQNTSQRDLEEFFRVTHPTIIGLLNRLKLKGYVRKEYNDDDRRKYVFLTDEGKKVCKELIVLQKKTETAVLADFAEKDSEKLISFLEKIYTNIKD
jgi:DNA-binding MarR family transcriptional regulator